MLLNKHNSRWQPTKPTMPPQPRLRIKLVRRRGTGPRLFGGACEGAFLHVSETDCPAVLKRIVLNSHSPHFFWCLASTGQVNNMQLAVVDPNAAYRGGMGGGMMGGGMMGGGMGGGALVPYQNQAAALIPAMEAEKVKQEASNYRVQRGTKPSRINASDQAFGPLLDQMMKK
mmetsp:Transcript_8831/g.39184  ORF Transcript_8831/g.39184 Transcript_8831/m.39184 type:complete len:172 (+) Transcript_8831:565-1080(+)